MMKILLVEDDDGQVGVFNDECQRFMRENNVTVDIEYARTFDEAMNRLEESLYDGAIVDLILKNDQVVSDTHDTYSGNRVIEEILANHRFPAAIFTGTPQENLPDYPLSIRSFIRGQDVYRDVLSEFFSIYQTGIMKVVGGRGQIEEAIDHVFWNHLLPRLDVWKSHVDDSEFDTEKTILRFTVTHLLELLENDPDKFSPEEVYITPPIRGDEIRTGCIVTHKETGNYYIVLTPACDLVLRGNDDEPKTPNTTDVLLSKIESLNIAESLCEATKSKKREQFFKRFANNNYALYYHFLPQADVFEGGVINFRKLVTIEPDKFFEKFNRPPTHQISSAFIKDIVARFATYYSRQGQPSFDATNWIESVV